jgi:hypothetical protein
VVDQGSYIKFKEAVPKVDVPECKTLLPATQDRDPLSVTINTLQTAPFIAHYANDEGLILSRLKPVQPEHHLQQHY